MINNFQYFSEDNIFLNIKIGSRITDLFEENDESLIQQYYRGQDKGIKWDNGSNEVIIFSKDCKISGYPDIDMQYVIAIYNAENAEFPSPNNAIIYNSDGSIYMQLRAPKIISNSASDEIFSKNASSLKDPYKLWFNGVTWANDQDGNLVTVMQIGFNLEWFEYRVIDAITGEFGSCLGSGRF